MALDTERQELHTLVDRMTDAQLRAARTLVATIVNPVDRSLANAPLDDEPLPAAEWQLLESRLPSSRERELFTLDDVLDELGISRAEFEEALEVADESTRG